jgi:putative transposase
MKGSRFSPEQKVNVILESLRGEKSISQICRENGISMSLYYQWRDKFMKGAFEGLSHRSRKAIERSKNGEIAQLKQLIGELTIENKILKKTEELINQR